jgi:hypothetical protein
VTPDGRRFVLTAAELGVSCSALAADGSMSRPVAVLQR